MATHIHIEPNLVISPRPPVGTSLAVNYSPFPLLQLGFNLPIDVSTASIFRTPPLNSSLSSFVVTALFDTGATYTSIDANLAKHLNLQVIGFSECRTAAGLHTMPNYAVDISFPTTKLSPFHNLRIGSSNLGFVLANNVNLPNPQNLGLLIGRDIITR